MSEGTDFDGCNVAKCLRSGPVTNWYLATQGAVGRTVVIKSLSPNVLPQSPFAAPLVREARILGRLQHKGVVTLYDLVRRDQRMWLVREYVDGETLAEILEKRGPLPAVTALAIAAQLAEALEYVHEQGVVHRDLQPKNILVSRTGGVKLSNFFLATELQSPAQPELLESDSGFAEPHYMSPEQVLGEAPDPRSDLFSLGVVLYEMLTGKRPFDAPDRRSTTQRIRHEAPAPVERGLHLPFVVERLLQRALQKVLSDRFADAREMKLALAQSLDELAPGTDLNALVSAGLAPNLAASAPKPALSRAPVQVSVSPLARALIVYLAAFLTLIGGITLIRALVGTVELAGAEPNTGLEHNRQNAGSLRVIARPWAHVFVDGAAVRTTPFAEPVPLRPGVHYIKLEHPDAPPVRRTVNLAAGQAVTLDIEMVLRTSVAPAPEPSPSGVGATDAGPPSP